MVAPSALSADGNLEAACREAPPAMPGKQNQNPIIRLPAGWSDYGL
jgi:hypothetical protein